MSRRRFLAGVIAGAVATACSSGSDSDASKETTGGKTTTSAGSTATTGGTAKPPPELSGDPFTLGVASGDPLPDSVILWTRLAPDPTKGGGMPDEAVDVTWEVGTDDELSDVIAQGVAQALPDLGHSVHVDVGDLDADTPYTYRFTVGEYVSPVGHTRTLPEEGSSPENLTFAFASCQDYQGGYYPAYDHMVTQDIAFLLFLGDYIYETGAHDAGVRKHVGGETITLEDYRNRYAQYRTDPALAAAHAAFPWMIIWDDHEVSNNYAGDINQQNLEDDSTRQRKDDAYQAWYEHFPVRLDPPDGEAEVKIYHDVAYGDLARFYLLDTRQYRDPVPCNAESPVDFGPTCAEREDPALQMLGTAQQGWLEESMAASDANWNVLAQQLMIMGLNTNPGDGEPTYFLDQWDGYPAARNKLLEFIRDNEIANPIVLTGDYHANFVGPVKLDPWSADSPPIATEFVGTSISTPPYKPDDRAANPQVQFWSAVNGYVMCTVTPETWTTQFIDVADATKPDSSVEGGSTWVVESGTIAATEA